MRSARLKTNPNGNPNITPKNMATYHCTVRAGSKGKAGPHAEYISRQGKYLDLRSGEKLEACEHGNMPAWAVHDPTVFWQAADESERANGSTYREIEVALPRELTEQQRLELVREFVHQEIGGKHVYSFAIHTPRAALDGGEQPHAHIMYSERTLDGIDRDPDQFFKRYNSKAPERGGCQKASGGKTHAERKAALVDLRKRWADLQNEHLERNAHLARVDHRSLADQGMDRSAEKHFGGKGVRKLQEQDIAALLDVRKADKEKDLAAQELKAAVVDLSTEVAKARQEHDRWLVQMIAEMRAKKEAKAKAVEEPAHRAIKISQYQREQKTAAIQPQAPMLPLKAEETVEQYAARKSEQYDRRFTIAKIGQRIVGTLQKIKEFAGQIYGIVEVGRGDRTLVRHDFNSADIGRMLKGYQRPYGFESDLDRAPKDRSRGLAH